MAEIGLGRKRSVREEKPRKCCDSVSMCMKVKTSCDGAREQGLRYNVEPRRQEQPCDEKLSGSVFQRTERKQ